MSRRYARVGKKCGKVSFRCGEEWLEDPGGTGEEGKRRGRVDEQEGEWEIRNVSRRYKRVGKRETGFSNNFSINTMHLIKGSAGWGDAGRGEEGLEDRGGTGEEGREGDG